MGVLFRERGTRIERQEDPDVVPGAMEIARQRRGDVRQTAGLGQRGDLGRAHTPTSRISFFYWS